MLESFSAASCSTHAFAHAIVSFVLVHQRDTRATPLQGASGNGHVEVVRALVDLGAAVNQTDVGWLEV